MFVLNFQWIPAGGTVVLFLVSSVRRLVTRPTLAVAKVDGERFALFIVLLLAGVATVLTLPRTFVNVRYHLPIYPLVLLLFLQALLSATSTRPVRICILGGTLAAFILATVRSADPLSAAAYQVFPFGSHRMYSMTLINQECCGLGRDQLVYNLEFTEFHYLLNQVLADVLTSHARVLAMHPLGNWHLLEAVDRASLRRALPSAGTFEPTVTTFDEVLHAPERPERVFYIELPAMDDRPELDRWSTLYRVAAPRIYSRGGFKLRVRELALIPSARP